MSWKDQKKRSEGEKTGRVGRMQRRREKLKAKEGERAIGCVFMLWSVSADRDERSKHASPLSPWSVSMETLFLTLTHILYVHPTCAVFPAVSMWFKWTVWKGRVLIMSYMWTWNNETQGLSSDPEEVKLQLIVFHGSEVRATVYPAVMQQYNLAVIFWLSHGPITNKSAEANITTVVVIWNNHFHRVYV